MNEEAIVESTSFINLQSSTNGGVFSINNIIISIKCCTFYNDRTSSFGGCIYGTQLTLSISKTTFSNCYVSQHVDNILGRVLYINGNSLDIKNCETFKCGIDISKSGDSVLQTENSLNIISNYNASSNYGLVGMYGFSFVSTQTDSYVKHCNIIDGKDYYAAHLSGNSCPINLTNFINPSTEGNRVFIGSNNIYVFHQCVFCEFHNLPYFASGYSGQFFNCISDNTAQVHAGVTRVENVELVKIKVYNLNCPKKTCHQKMVIFQLNFSRIGSFLVLFSFNIKK